MTSGLLKTFERCKSNGQTALMPFLTSGYPSNSLFVELIKTVSSAGADMIEIGIPFSDPMADGETIQETSQVALNNGTNIDSTFECISKLKSLNTPIILMSYFNPIYRYGVARFIKHASSLGIKGLIIPDMIPEESLELERLAHKHRIDFIYLLAPTSDNNRTKLIVSRSHGFVYLVSIAGVTGARKAIPRYLSGWIKKVKQVSKLPVCVGFGISDSRQASEVARYADGVIVGSALADIIMAAPTNTQKIKQASKFIKHLRSNLNNANNSSKTAGK